MRYHNSVIRRAKAVLCFVVTAALLMLAVSAIIPENGNPSAWDSGNAYASTEQYSTDRSVGDVVTDFGDAIGSAVTDARDGVGDIASGIGDAARDAGRAGSEMLSDVGDAIDGSMADGNSSQNGAENRSDGIGTRWVLILILIAAAAALIILFAMPRRRRSH